MTARDMPLTSFLSRDDLTAAFDGYFETVSKIHAIAARRDDDDALRLIALRRDLSRHFQDINRELAEAAFTITLASDLATIFAECNAMLSAERTAVAEHQARWNAPAMHRDREGYERDTRQLFRLHQKNHRWRKSVFLPMFVGNRPRTPKEQ